MFGTPALIKSNRVVVFVGEPDIPTNIKLVEIPETPTDIQVEV